MRPRPSIRADEPTRLDPWLWLVAVVFFGVGDVTTTGVGLNVAGVVEAGPVVAPLVRRNGLVALVLLKLAAFCAGYLCWKSVPRPYRAGVPLGLSILGLSATAWNCHVLLVALST